MLVSPQSGILRNFLKINSILFGNCNRLHKFVPAQTVHVYFTIFQ